MTAFRPSPWLAYTSGALAALLVATLGTSVTDLGPWYQLLSKPSWQPPGWIFVPAWTAIFGLWGLSAALAWRAAPDDVERDWVVSLFALNGLLNVFWSFLFFYLKRPDWALHEAAVLWLSIAVMILFLARFAKLSAWLLVPYLAWVSYAIGLNYAVVRLNAPF